MTDISGVYLCLIAQTACTGIIAGRIAGIIAGRIAGIIAGRIAGAFMCILN